MTCVQPVAVRFPGHLFRLQPHRLAYPTRPLSVPHLRLRRNDRVVFWSGPTAQSQSVVGYERSAPAFGARIALRAEPVRTIPPTWRRPRRFEGLTMLRRLAACVLVFVLMAASPATGVLAQDKETSFVAGGGQGRYAAAAPAQLMGAFDRAMAELDATSAEASPEEVKAASFRRRILELRLLMDLDALAYDGNRMKGYRDTVDRVYESVGVYQDLAVIKKQLDVEVSQDVVNGRRAEMNDALWPLRDQRMRGELRRFFGAPLKAPRSGKALRTPRIWDVAGALPTDNFDSTGNAAVQDVRQPVLDMIDVYDDVKDAFTAYDYAQAAGLDTGAIRAKVHREFDKAQTLKASFVDARVLDGLEARLNGVRDGHRQGRSR